MMHQNVLYLYHAVSPGIVCFTRRLGNIFAELSYFTGQFVQFEGLAWACSRAEHDQRLVTQCAPTVFPSSVFGDRGSVMRCSWLAFLDRLAR
jgi:hypothetical protein